MREDENMLSRENYTEVHINDLRAQTSADPSILERTVFAFGLLEAIRIVELPFIFKGGTALLALEMIAIFEMMLVIQCYPHPIKCIDLADAPVMTNHGAQFNHVICDHTDQDQVISFKKYLLRFRIHHYLLSLTPVYGNWHRNCKITGAPSVVMNSFLTPLPIRPPSGVFLTIPTVILLIS